MSYAVFAVLVANGIMVSLVLFWVMPHCAVSRLRYRLWECRDNLANDIRRGQFLDSAPASLVLHRIESAIRRAPELSFFNMWLLWVLSRGKNDESREQLMGADKLKSEGDKTLLAAHMDRFERVVAGHAMFHTWSGRFVVLFFAPAAVVALLVRGFGPRHRPSDLYEAAKAKVREEAPVKTAVEALAADSSAK